MIVTVLVLKRKRRVPLTADGGHMDLGEFFEKAFPEFRGSASCLYGLRLFFPHEILSIFGAVCRYSIGSDCIRSTSVAGTVSSTSVVHSTQARQRKRNAATVSLHIISRCACAPGIDPYIIFLKTDSQTPIIPSISALPITNATNPAHKPPIFFPNRGPGIKTSPCPKSTILP